MTELGPPAIVVELALEARPRITAVRVGGPDDLRRLFAWLCLQGHAELVTDFLRSIAEAPVE